jgi:4-amino-4-deoxy-L-arabinose transferase-like glycosyltransferase
MWRWVFPLLIILLGTWLRFHALAQDRRFHPDEALFSTFARAAAINGDWMLPGALDKPPLAIYANALSQVFIGEGEFAARLPGTFASILLLPLMSALSQRFYGNRTRPHRRAPLLAMLLTALSPFAIAFSATAFTDGMMLLLMTLALWLIAAGHWGWSGLALALAFACKHQALFYLPLILALGLVGSHGGAALRNRFLRFLSTFAIGITTLLIWDNTRDETSIFALAAANNDPWRLIRANEILPRMMAWLTNAQTLISTGSITFVFILIALAALAIRVIRQPRHRAVVIDLIFFTFILAYALLHWLVAFNTYDRYLLPLLPPLILLVSRGVAAMGMIYHAPRTRRFFLFTNQRNNFLLILICALMLIPALDAAEGRTLINGEYQQYEGIDQLAAYLNSKPVATVIYDRWLGWELAYYMGQWTDKRRVYYPTPHELARGALALCKIGLRYLPAPTQQPITPYLEALREAGFGVTQVYDTHNFVVYEIIVEAVSSSAESSSPDLLESCGDESP